MLKKILLGLLLVVVVGIAVAYFVRNLVVARAIESGSTYALGVETDLGSANLSLGAGELGLNDYEVRNPEGFNGRHILVMHSGVLDVETGSVFSRDIVVDSLVLEGIKINLEQVNQKGNFAVLMDNIKKLNLGESSKSDMRIRIKKVAVRDINVAASLSILGKQYDKSFTVDNITLQDVGGDSGLPLSEVVARIINTVLAKAVASGKGVMPGDFGNVLSGSVEQGKAAIESEVTDQLKKLGGSLSGDKK